MEGPEEIISPKYQCEFIGHIQFVKTKCPCMATPKTQRHLKRCLSVGQKNDKVKRIENAHALHILCRCVISLRAVLLHCQFWTIHESWKNARRFVTQWYTVEQTTSRKAFFCIKRKKMEKWINISFIRRTSERKARSAWTKLLSTEIACKST